MNRKDLFIFMGPPGAGKGTLSRLCVQELGFTQLSTGYLCRKHIAEKTTIGKKIDFVIKSGKLISDSIIVDMVQEWLTEHTHSINGIILDGFPRTRAQADALQTLLVKGLPYFTIHVVRLSISQDTVVQRLLNRSICQNKDCQAVYSLALGSRFAPKEPTKCDVCASPLVKRADDTDSVVHERLKDYQCQERELVDFYQAHDIAIQEVNVEQPLEIVFEEFKKLYGHQPLCC